MLDKRPREALCKQWVSLTPFLCRRYYEYYAHFKHEAERLDARDSGRTGNRNQKSEQHRNCHTGPSSPVSCRQQWPATDAYEEGVRKNTVGQCWTICSPWRSHPKPPWSESGLNLLSQTPALNHTPTRHKADCTECGSRRRVRTQVLFPVLLLAHYATSGMLLTLSDFSYPPLKWE